MPNVYMRDTSESIIAGVFDRKDKFLGFKDRAGTFRPYFAGGYALATMGIIGDSIAEGQQVRIPLPEADSGWYPSIYSDGLVFVKSAHCSINCGATDAVSLKWDGVKYMTVAVAGDTDGNPVDITGGGYFVLTSGTNGKQVFVVIRWANRPAAWTQNVVNAGTPVFQRTFFGELFAGALAAAGLGHVAIKNYAIGGDKSGDVLSRIKQFIDSGIDAAMVMVGINSITANQSGATVYADIKAIVDALSAAGIFVFLSTTLPAGTLTAAQATAWADLNARIGTEFRKDSYANDVHLMDLALPAANPTGASGTALIVASMFTSDNLHPSSVLTLGPAAQIAKTALLTRYQRYQRIPRITAADKYDAVNNPYGNLIGTRAGMSGTAGTKGAVATGELPDNWVDQVQGAGTWSALAYTAPGSASPIARDSGQGGYYLRMQGTAGAATCSRYIYVDLETGVTGGKEYMCGLTVRLRNTVGLTGFDVFLSVSGTTMGPRLVSLGNVPIASATISDTGDLHFVNRIKMPAGVSNGRLYIQPVVVANGQITLDLAAPFIRPVA